MDVKQKIRTQGFSLIEMIIVITLIGFALAGLTASLYPRSIQTAEQITSVKAADLGRSVLDEVMGRGYDHFSGVNGGVPECAVSTISTPGQQLCTLPNDLGPESGETDANGVLVKSLANDVDDFHGLRGRVEDVLDSDLSDLGYRNFNVEIDVFYDAAIVNGNAVMMSGEPSISRTHYKRVEVVIIDSQGNRYPFSAIKGNF
ncbi:MSHA biogenesis protein MshD [Vibrio tasmaniensis ZS-17]|uniref:type IV pilus modification PilV family protein n=1 Tax=Vibrio tasmaniensis TaxID=212663 RepID=UPI00031880AF|nr:MULTISPECIES: prepilin-type N-terminal cleavage/methylation domain-containing protein [Vibrio]OED65717.1 MSHA biogenesis protein MshD [Vibrio tasmaniensis ZS-17]PMI00123.1 MSHA biogenesis protein MshD [Vibrio lentus]